MRVSFVLVHYASSRETHGPQTGVDAQTGFQADSLKLPSVLGPKLH